MRNTKFGTFDDLLQITEETVRPIAIALRETVFKVDQNACEVVRLGDRAATYGVGPRKMLDGYVYILPYKRWVNLGFYQGIDLADPKELLEGTGAKMRHVKIRSIDDAKRSEVRALIKAALTRRRETLRS
ncbi:MAG: DUF1801 domain-containing protein [Rhodothermaceae bacterium]|nr:DUF1801 domain-containing protein [Rhodothermaceae bacterium]MXX59859.1 DUF1801 domain-containing protein [Rhodothermaceae bacterium]MYD18573.1 DUF1801 domain-containing protein [Rhodothermaceae bacterium]MYD56754.1 DUF1801 domain-containing protein [Rhodothermaceae bacterium]MYI42724.1 DUF1801 domain-containing protein [Rhodothermaceae bacterium]